MISCCCFNSLISFFGVITISYSLFTFIKFLLKHFKKPSDNVLKKLAKNDSQWAVVTGASDGIGKAYAKTLAKKGFNIFLISRTQSKLEAVAKEIELENVKTKIKSVDFINADDSIFNEIEEELSPLSIAILVNNVGVNYSFPQHFLEAKENEDSNIIKVNITVTNKMTRITLPKMIENGGGAIINLSSMAGRIPQPMLAVYSGTKAYIDFFSKSLAQEYKNQGIIVQSVTPGLVVSNMSKVRKTSMIVCSPEVIATRSLGKLGDEIELSPFYTHGILNHVFKILPNSFTSNYLYKMNKGIQKKALRKLGNQ